jgi:hypothetical protein
MKLLLTLTQQASILVVFYIFITMVVAAFIAPVLQKFVYLRTMKANNKYLAAQNIEIKNKVAELILEKFVKNMKDVSLNEHQFETHWRRLNPTDEYKDYVKLELIKQRKIIIY